MDDTELKVGDKVKYTSSSGDLLFVGEITIISQNHPNHAKVIPEGQFDWNYDYYPIRQLTKLTEEEFWKLTNP